MSPILHSIRRKLMATRRKIYGLRSFIPGLRRKHQFEAMVGPLGYWDQLQAYQLNLLQKNGLSADSTLLDLGCGPLQGGVAFIRYLGKGQYAAVDSNPTRIDAAHLQISIHKLSDKNPFLTVSDSFGDNELGDRLFDFVWASQILYYFDDPMLDRLMIFLSKRLKSDGIFLGDILAQSHYEFQYPEIGYIHHTVENIDKIAGKHGLYAKSLGEIVQFGYPARLSLHTNELIRISRKKE